MGLIIGIYLLYCIRFAPVSECREKQHVSYVIYLEVITSASVNIIK